jgi:hypothetical protein
MKEEKRREERKSKRRRAKPGKELLLFWIHIVVVGVSTTSVIENVIIRHCVLQTKPTKHNQVGLNVY